MMLGQEKQTREYKELLIQVISQGEYLDLLESDVKSI